MSERTQSQSFWLLTLTANTHSEHLQRILTANRCRERVLKTKKMTGSRPTPKPCRREMPDRIYILTDSERERLAELNAPLFAALNAPLYGAHATAMADINAKKARDAARDAAKRYKSNPTTNTAAMAHIAGVNARTARSIAASLNKANQKAYTQRVAKIDALWARIERRHWRSLESMADAGGTSGA
jgi:hypothetical protein